MINLNSTLNFNINAQRLPILVVADNNPSTVNIYLVQIRDDTINHRSGVPPGGRLQTSIHTIVVRVASYTAVHVHRYNVNIYQPL